MDITKGILKIFFRIIYTFVYKIRIFTKVFSILVVKIVNALFAIVIPKLVIISIMGALERAVTINFLIASTMDD